MTCYFKLDLEETTGARRRWVYSLSFPKDKCPAITPGFPSVIALEERSEYYVATLATEAWGLYENAIALDKTNKQPQILRLSALSNRLADRLDFLYSALGECAEARASLRYLFSDSYLKRSGSQYFLKLGQLGSISKNKEALAAAAGFYKAICLFLSDGERYIALEAWLVYLFAAWQWYNLLKYLTDPSYPAKGTERPSTSQQSEVPDTAEFNDLIEEMAVAYRLVKQLLDDSRFAEAIRWLAVWKTSQIKPGPILHEQMRLSLPLSSSPGSELAFDQPLSAPGCFSDACPNWSITRLHPTFSDLPGGQSEVRELITAWLLPRYDYANALHLARLLRDNHARGKRYGLVGLPILVALGFFTPLIAGSYIVLSYGGISASPWWMPITVALVELVVLFFIPIGWGATHLDGTALVHLALPRLMGGVLIGYFSVILQGDSLKVSAALWRDWPYWSILWALVLIVGYVYLYYDVCPLVNEKGVARQRTITILFLAVVISAVIGLGAIALTTAMVGLGDSLLTWCGGGCFMGPFGWVDFQQYLTFVPLALFTGLVTQFIFEERTMTASVWSPEQD